jgi:hypothetical protein
MLPQAWTPLLLQPNQEYAQEDKHKKAKSY